MSCSPPLRCMKLGHARHRVVVAHDAGGGAQVANGFKQRHHDELRLRGAAVQRALHQAHFFLQQQHFQQVAHGFGVADDVVAGWLRARRLAAFCAPFQKWPVRWRSAARYCAPTTRRGRASHSRRCSRAQRWASSRLRVVVFDAGRAPADRPPPLRACPSFGASPPWPGESQTPAPRESRGAGGVRPALRRGGATARHQIVCKSCQNSAALP